MPQYRVLAKSYIGNRIVEEGEVVDFDGEPSDNLELVEAEKPAKGKKAADASGEKAGEGLV